MLLCVQAEREAAFVARDTADVAAQQACAERMQAETKLQAGQQLLQGFSHLLVAAQLRHSMLAAACTTAQQLRVKPLSMHAAAQAPGQQLSLAHTSHAKTPEEKLDDWLSACLVPQYGPRFQPLNRLQPAELHESHMCIYM